MLEENRVKMTREYQIEMLARMWMKCDPNRIESDPDEIIGQSCDGSPESGRAILTYHDTPLTGKPRWHWFIPRAEASLKFLQEAGLDFRPV